MTLLRRRLDAAHTPTVSTMPTSADAYTLDDLRRAAEMAYTNWLQADPVDTGNEPALYHEMRAADERLQLAITEAQTRMGRDSEMCRKELLRRIGWGGKESA